MASRFKQIRHEKGYSQYKISARLGIDQSDLSRIEHGLKDPTVSQLKRLAILYNTSMDYLMGLTDNPDPYISKIFTK